MYMCIHKGLILDIFLNHFLIFFLMCVYGMQRKLARRKVCACPSVYVKVGGQVVQVGSILPPHVAKLV